MPAMSITWDHIASFDKMQSAKLLDTIQLCELHFGSRHDRWDYSAFRSNPMWQYRSVKFYFKNQEDLVQFKLTYTHSSTP